MLLVQRRVTTMTNKMKMEMDHGDGEGGAGSALDDHIDQSILISCC